MLTVIEYALNHATKQGWKKKVRNSESVSYGWMDLLRSMSQKIGEIKREQETTSDGGSTVQN